MQPALRARGADVEQASELRHVLGRVERAEPRVHRVRSHGRRCVRAPAPAPAPLPVALAHLPAQQRRPAAAGARSSPGRITASNSSPFALCSVITCTRDDPASRRFGEQAARRRQERVEVGQVAAALVLGEQREHAIGAVAIERRLGARGSAEREPRGAHAQREARMAARRERGRDGAQQALAMRALLSSAVPHRRRVDAIASTTVVRRRHRRRPAGRRARIRTTARAAPRATRDDRPAARARARATAGHASPAGRATPSSSTAE